MNTYTIDMARSVVPSHMLPAFDRALSWSTRVKAWGWPMNKAFKSVADGRRLVVTGYREDVLRQAAKQYGLNVSSEGRYAFLPQNSDIVALVQWSDSASIDAALKHIIKGVCLSYPINDILSFAGLY